MFHIVDSVKFLYVTGFYCLLLGSFMMAANDMILGTHSACHLETAM